MKTIFKLFALEETHFITSVSLSSTGISTDDEMIVVRRHVADFDSELDAINFINIDKHQPDNPEHGFEIVKTLHFTTTTTKS